MRIGKKKNFRSKPVAKAKSFDPRPECSARGARNSRWAASQTGQGDTMSLIKQSLHASGLVHIFSDLNGVAFSNSDWLLHIPFILTYQALLGPRCTRSLSDENSPATA